MKIALCLLTLNEIDCLKIIFPKIQKPNDICGYQMIYAIDGGSIDGTQEFFKENNIEIIGQSKKGRGEAFKLAFEKVNADAYIFFSPDGNENLDDLQKFSQFFKNGAELVIASRMMPGAFNEEDISWWRPRKWANLVFNLLANLAFNNSDKYISDSINGFRGITRQSAKKLQLSASDYTIEYQMTIQAMKKKINIVEFPTHEGQRVAGKSGILSLPAGIRFIKRFFYELFRFKT
ncbi:MAG: glycosyltransferase [Pseudobdellovibrio sp.]